MPRQPHVRDDGPEECELTARLRSWTPSRLAARLGLRPDDAEDAAVLVAEVLADPGARSGMAGLVRALQSVVGDFDGLSRGLFGEDADAVAFDSAALGHRVHGGLALVALLASTAEVRAFHAAHGISEQQTWRSLSDLGQQVWVHRRTFGEFGLHTQGWLVVVWCGALHWLGRLQFNLVRLAEDGVDDPGWQLSTHIPEAGPLGADAVEHSLRQAVVFFTRHHPEQVVRRLHCRSWLLDPTLATELPGTNLAAFQRRWTLTGEGGPGTEDALFFTFRRRGDVDLDSLPAETRLQRLVLQRIRTGAGWTTTEGVAPLPASGVPTGGVPATPAEERR